jgi:hypothetical protein
MYPQTPTLPLMGKKYILAICVQYLNDKALPKRGSEVLPLVSSLQSHVCLRQICNSRLRLALVGHAISLEELCLYFKPLSQAADSHTV